MKYTNKLSILLICTQQEYLQGQVEKCLRMYFESNASSKYQIDLRIAFNKGKLTEYSNLNFLTKFKNLRNITVFSAGLSGLNDLYARTNQDLNMLNLSKMPDLGGSAGPNNLFFDSMFSLFKSEYDHILTIECDTRPVVDFWLDKLIDYCSSHSFLISGSMYKGSAMLPSYETWTGHINGVAIYRNCKMLWFLLQQSKNFIKHLVTNNINRYCSFDVGISQYLSTYTGMYYFRDKSKPKNQVIQNDIISNLSLDIDKKYKLDDIRELYPSTIILHQKY